MKNFIFILICLLSCKINSQSFEGRLEYLVNSDIVGDSIFNGLEKKDLINKSIKEGKIPNDTLTYFYSKSGNFLSMSNNEGVDFITIYLQKNNLIYQFAGESNFVSVVNASIDLEEQLGTAPEMRILEEKEQIGDFNCSIVEVRWKSGVYKYYYSNDILKINPELYKDYNYDQFYQFLKIANSLPLKIEKQINNFYKTTYILYSYTDEKVNEKIFNIPKMKENKELSKVFLNKKIFVIE